MVQAVPELIPLGGQIPAVLGVRLHLDRHLLGHLQPERLQLIFNPYAVGPYVSGTFLVNIPYTALKALFAADGPLGTLR